MQHNKSTYTKKGMSDVNPKLTRSQILDRDTHESGVRAGYHGRHNAGTYCLCRSAQYAPYRHLDDYWEWLLWPIVNERRLARERDGHGVHSPHPRLLERGCPKAHLHSWNQSLQPLRRPGLHWVCIHIWRAHLL